MKHKTLHCVSCSHLLTARHVGCSTMLQRQYYLVRKRHHVYRQASQYRQTRYCQEATAAIANRELNKEARNRCASRWLNLKAVKVGKQNRGSTSGQVWNDRVLGGEGGGGGGERQHWPRHHTCSWHTVVCTALTKDHVMSVEERDINPINLFTLNALALASKFDIFVVDISIMFTGNLKGNTF